MSNRDATLFRCLSATPNRQLKTKRAIFSLYQPVSISSATCTLEYNSQQPEKNKHALLPSLPFSITIPIFLDLAVVASSDSSNSKANSRPSIVLAVMYCDGVMWKLMHRHFFSPSPFPWNKLSASVLSNAPFDHWFICWFCVSFTLK